MHVVLNQGSVEVLFDAVVQVRVHGFGILFYTNRNDGDLVGNHLSSGQRLSQGFGLGLVILACDFSAESHDTLITILGDRDVFETGLIQRALRLRILANREELHRISLQTTSYISIRIVVSHKVHF